MDSQENLHLLEQQNSHISLDIRPVVLDNHKAEETWLEWIPAILAGAGFLYATTLIYSKVG